MLIFDPRVVLMLVLGSRRNIFISRIRSAVVVAGFWSIIIILLILMSVICLFDE